MSAVADSVSSSDLVALAQPCASERGLVVDGVSVKAMGRRTLVTITVDLPEDQVGSADLDDVAEVSRAISGKLDGENVFGDSSYVLEVSTPGVDRPLTERRHWSRARTRMVTAVLASGGSQSGRLVGVGDDGVVLEKGDATIDISWDDLSKGRVEVEFSRPGGQKKSSTKTKEGRHGH